MFVYSVCLYVCVGVYIHVDCPGHTTEVSSGEPTPSSIKISQVTDLTGDVSPIEEYFVYTCWVEPLSWSYY